MVFQICSLVFELYSYQSPWSIIPYRAQILSHSTRNNYNKVCYYVLISQEIKSTIYTFNEKNIFKILFNHPCDICTCVCMHVAVYTVYKICHWRENKSRKIVFFYVCWDVGLCYIEEVCVCVYLRFMKLC